MSNYFDGVKTIEQAKKIYRKFAMELHPDQGGDEEEFKVFQNDFESFLKTFMASATSEWEKKTGKEFNGNIYAFAHIIREIIHLNVRIEVIGYWIYAFESLAVKDILKEKGFWFSGKHKAWIYSGGAKKSFRSKYNTDDVRNMHGYSVIKDREELKKVASV